MVEKFIERPLRNEKDKAMQYLKELLEQARKDNRNEDVENLEELTRLLHTKKYGLVWEEHAEFVEEEMKTKIPVFVEDPDRKIVGDPENADYNFLLEGDNLHSLHLLEKTHTGKIDVIYIDPPYNTGNKDFKYNDKIVGQEDTFLHSKWLSFMESRLKIARNLLSDDGVIAVSIDYHEGYQLKLLMDEIFGEENFATDLHVETSAIAGHRRISAMNGTVVKTTEFVFIYTKTPHTKIINHKFYDEIDGFDTHYSKFLNPETGFLENFSATLQNTKIVAEIFDQYKLKPSLKNLDKLIKVDERLKAWLYSDEISGNLFRLDTKLKANVVEFKPGLNYWKNKYVVSNENGTQYTAFRYSDRIGQTDGYKPSFSERAIRGNLWKGFSSDGGNLSKEGGVNLKNGKKPLRLIKQLIKALGTSKSIVVLDFFAGSGTTGHAVAQLNKEDGGNRKYILCTNNENNICEEITYKRLTNIQEDLPHNLKYFKTDFVDKTKFPDFTLENELLNYVTPLVELEFGVDISDPSVQVILTEERLEELLRNNELKERATLFIHPDIFLDSKEQKQLKELNITLQEIPDYFFGKELWQSNY